MGPPVTGRSPKPFRGKPLTSASPACGPLAYGTSAVPAAILFAPASGPVIVASTNAYHAYHRAYQRPHHGSYLRTSYHQHPVSLRWDQRRPLLWNYQEAPQAPRPVGCVWLHERSGLWPPRRTPSGKGIQSTIRT
jgi:hypothetical protein